MNQETKDNYDYSAYVGVGHNSRSENELAVITRLAEAQHNLQQKVEQLEEDLKTAKKDLAKYAEQYVPEEMEKLGLSTYSTKSGIQVKVQENIQAGLTVENRPKGCAWLEENGYGGIIKSEVIVPFRRNEIKEANELVSTLTEQGRLANLERNVHPQTLKAFVREQLAQGKELPLDIFGVIRKNVAKVEL